MDHAVILAGGHGERFWPLSRRKRPKQLLPIIGDQSLLETTIERIKPDFPAERIWIVTSEEIGKAVQDRVKFIPKENVLMEPCGCNTAIAIGQSMTCLAALPGHGDELRQATTLFDAVGTTLVIDESMMESATALCACGIAFFLRSIRAASQGGIEIGFHPEEALLMAAQTARGAAGLLMREGAHPESEIDRVTTPRGCTIAGLNEMEHRGFSSAMIKGILTSARKAMELYRRDS